MNLLLAKKTHPADNRIVNSVTNLYFWYTSHEKPPVFVGKSQGHSIKKGLHLLTQPPI